MGGQRIALRGLKFGSAGQTKIGAAIGASMRVGPFAMLVRGGEFDIPAAARAHARLAQDLNAQQLNLQGAPASAHTTAACRYGRSITTGVIPMHSSLCRPLLLALRAAFHASAQTERTTREAVAQVVASEGDQTVAVEATATVSESAAKSEPASKKADGKKADKTVAIGEPPAGRGQIVFFRPSKFAGGAIGYKVREGACELDKLSNGTYFVHVAEPGKHEYIAHWQAKDLLPLDVEAGETYSVRGTVSMGILAGRPNLPPSDEAAFRALAGKLKSAQ